MKVYLVLLVICLVPTLGTSKEEYVHIRTDQGLLRGKSMNSRNGNKFYAFLEVPYAKPPLGELRFRAPEEPESWQGVRNAAEDHYFVCPQRNFFSQDKFVFMGHEDCLFLYIYTPKLNCTHNELLPVMVFIHGGGWNTGSGSSILYSPNYILDKEVVFVTFNYRLGPLGFLSTEDEDLPGNNGLKDQSLALKWIKKNIKNFGGNPDLVTIFGESAGGASVHYHMMSPMSEGLFHRAISESGSALCSWALGHPGATRNNTLKLAQTLQCPTTPTKDMVDCLRKKSAEDLIKTVEIFEVWFRQPIIAFKPVVENFGKDDDKFLPEHPETAIRNGKVADVPWMTGMNSGEGSIVVAGIYKNKKLIEEFESKFDEIVPLSFFYKHSASDVEKTTKSIRNFYFKNKKIGDEDYLKVTDLWSDGLFTVGGNEAARLMSETLESPVYYYYLSYRGTASFSSVFGGGDRDYGVCHIDELIYLFPYEKIFLNVSFNDLDNKFMKLILDLWTSFAESGKPTSDLLETDWKPVETEKLEYLHLAKDKIEMETNPLRERIKFWASLKSDQKLWSHDEL